jgi:hypothetical protein
MKEIRVIEGTKEDIETSLFKLNQKYKVNILSARPVYPDKISVMVEISEKPKKSFLEHMIRK